MLIAEVLQLLALSSIDENVLLAACDLAYDSHRAADFLGEFRELFFRLSLDREQEFEVVTKVECEILLSLEVVEGHIDLGSLRHLGVIDLERHSRDPGHLEDRRREPVRYIHARSYEPRIREGQSFLDPRPWPSESPLGIAQTKLALE